MLRLERQHIFIVIDYTIISKNKDKCKRRSKTAGCQISAADGLEMDDEKLDLVGADAYMGLRACSQYPAAMASTSFAERRAAARSKVG